MTEATELQTKKKSGHSEKRKVTNTLEYWKRKPSNKTKEKMKKRILQENEKTTPKPNYIAEISSKR